MKNHCVKITYSLVYDIQYYLYRPEIENIVEAVEKASNEIYFSSKEKATWIYPK